MKNILISFVGINDGAGLKNKTDGAVLTALKNRKFDELILLWTPPNNEHNFYKITIDLKKEIEIRKFVKKVGKIEFDVDNPADHNEIYPKLLEICKSLPENENYTAAIASGTPAMQVCWILMAESGDFKINLIRSNEAKYGRPAIIEIKLGTGLPKVIKNLQTENKTLRALLPKVNMNLEKGEVKIGEIKIPLSPIQFAFYRYFLERILDDKEYERFSGIETPKLFHKKIIDYHKQSFPDSELFIQSSEKLLHGNMGYDMRTFRANISKLNKRIKDSLNDKLISRYFEIETEGKRHSLQYGINLTPDKINIK